MAAKQQAIGSQGAQHSLQNFRTCGIVKINEHVAQKNDVKWPHCGQRLIQIDGSKLNVLPNGGVDEDGVLVVALPL